jgi:DNA polymerase (family 10)
MENVEIAAALSKVADLLDIQGGNPFKVRAYRTAVRTIGNLTRPLSELVAEGADLQELPGIGKDMAGYIVELLTTSHLHRLDALAKQVPAGLVELMRVEGLGPRKARRLHDELGVRTLDDLARALDTGRLEELAGFGAKTAANLRRALDELRSRPARTRLSEADQLVRPLLGWMRGAPGIERLEAAGSYRRRAETVGDVDLLAICARPAPVMERFTDYPDVLRVEAAGRTRGTVVLRAGLKVDLRILPRPCYGAALHYFTGSKAHNIAVRKLGVARGLRISEYGVFRVTKGKGKGRRIGGAEEEDVFRAVGMAWVPPELRENRGEIEAALAGRLPKLVELADIRGDLQCHSDWTDGHDTIEAMARSAIERGYQYLAITDHSRAVAMAGGLTPAKLERQWKEIAGVRRKLGDRLRLLRGLEVDILRDGRLDLPDSHLRQLDVVVVAVHSHFGLSRAAQTERVIKAIAHPGVHILAHPTGRILNEREPIELDVEAVLAAAAAHGVAVELNAQPDRLDLSDVYVRRAKELGARVVVNSDAHWAGTLGFMRCGVDQARRGWLEAGDLLNTLPLAQLEAWLARRRAPARAARTRPPAASTTAAAARGTRRGGRRERAGTRARARR